MNIQLLVHIYRLSLFDCYIISYFKMDLLLLSAISVGISWTLSTSTIIILKLGVFFWGVGGARQISLEYIATRNKTHSR